MENNISPKTPRLETTPRWFKPKAAPHERKQPPIPSQEGKGGEISQATFEFILQAGIQAPSGENTQPWRFALSGSTISVYQRPDADLSVFNYKYIGNILACGAVVENIVIAASACGLAAEVSYFEGGNNCVAKVNLRRAEVAADPLLESIWKRATNRKPYHKNAAIEWVMLELEAEIARFPGIRVHSLIDPSKIKLLSKLFRAVEWLRITNKNAHHFLHSHIYYSEESARKAGDGFPIMNLEAGVLGNIFLRFTKPWVVMQLMNKLGFWRPVADISAKLIRESSAIVLVTTQGFTQKDFLLGGRAFERVWLTLTELGFSAQPMTLIMLLSEWYNMNCLENMPAANQSYFIEKITKYQELFPEVDFSREGQAMLFRIGKGPPISSFTYRYPLTASVSRENRT